MATTTDWDYKSWLDEAGKQANLKPETRKLLEQAFNHDEGARKYASQSFLRQSDYSKQQDALREQREELQRQIGTKEAELESYKSDLSGWRTTNSQKLEAAENSLSELNSRFTRVTQAMKQVSEEYGIPIPADVSLDPLPAPTPAATSTHPRTGETVADNNPNYLTHEDFGKVGTVLKQLPFHVLDIYGEHQKLFGAPPENMSGLLEKAEKSNRTLRDVWEREYKVPERRTELQNQDMDRRVNERAEQLAQQRISESLVPSGQRQTHSSAVLNRFNNPQPTRPAADLAIPEEPKNPARGVLAAVQAQMDGRYKQSA